jgi:hypothetical protein
MNLYFRIRPWGGRENGSTGSMGYSQEKASEYVSPSEAVPRAKLPKCRFNC